MTTPSSDAAQELLRALADLEAVLEVKDRGRARPTLWGDPRDADEDVLATLDVRLPHGLPDDVRAWFRWLRGRNLDELTGKDTFDETWALREWEGDQEFGLPPTHLPLAGTDGFLLHANCSGLARTPVGIWRPEGAGPESLPSLADLVQVWVLLLELDVLHLDAGGRELVQDRERAEALSLLWPGLTG